MSEKKYRRMRVDLFNHAKTAPLSLEAKILMLYLTTPHAAGISCRSTTQMRNGVDARKPVAVIEDALAELVAAGLVMWDKDFEVVWLIEAFDEQVCSQCTSHPNMAKAVMAHLETLPPSSVKSAFLQRYGQWLRRSGIQLPGEPPALRVIEAEVAGHDCTSTTSRRAERHDSTASARPPDPCRNRSANPSRKGFDNPFTDPSVDPSRNQEQKQKQNQEQEQKQRGLDTEHRGSKRHARDGDRIPNPRRALPESDSEYDAVERRVSAAFDAAHGSALGPGAAKEAMERWSERHATEAEVLRVIDWWSRNRATAPRYLRDCFKRSGAGAAWSRITIQVLGRKPGEDRGRRSSRAPTSALAHTQAEWAAIKAEPEPELDPEFLNLPNRVGGMT